jgi:hypothetical protein
VDPRAGLNDVKNRKFLTLPGLELQLLSRPARSQSLYRLFRLILIRKHRKQTLPQGNTTVFLKSSICNFEERRVECVFYKELQLVGGKMKARWIGEFGHVR